MKRYVVMSLPVEQDPRFEKVGWQRASFPLKKDDAEAYEVILKKKKKNLVHTKIEEVEVDPVEV